MLISRTLLEQIQIRFSYQKLTQTILVLIVLTFIVQASWKLLQPIQYRQYVHVLELSQQAAHTQAMAKNLLAQEQIKRRAYLRLMAAQQQEAAAIQYYAPDQQSP